MRVGAMRLETCIGRGGMGEVWRGHHLDLQIPIALKILRTPDPHHRAAFLNEIRAISTLAHPHIIDIVEQGQTDVSTGSLQKGRPYLAMELAEGTIMPRCGQLDWPAVKHTLLVLLSALGHAHARGLLHGDLKPGNVLVVGETLKLTDFGLARRLGRPPESSMSMGTPRYMAPEQVVSRWREAGPWTDLFSLGRLAEALVFGRPGRSGRYPPACPVPKGFYGWLARLIAPDPTHRFQRAADAAHALRTLPEAPLYDAVPVPVQPTQAADTLTLEAYSSSHADETWDSASWSDEPPTTPPAEGLGEPPIPLRATRPPLPARVSDLDFPAQKVQRHGLSLVGIRAPQTVGRSREQDVLWAQLHAVCTGALRVCVLGGAPGAGKRRLASWLSERAHEVGAVTVLTARHTERSQNALGRMLAHSLNSSGLGRDAVAARVEATLRKNGESDPYEWHGLTEMIHPTGAIQLASRSARYALLQRHLARLAAQQGRPVVLCLEDAQWGDEALGFAMHLLRARKPPPVLVLVTWAPVPDRPLENRMLRTLRRQAGVEDIQLTPLPLEDIYRLAHHSLGLAPMAAHMVAEHAQGSPLFAVQLVRYWAERGLLEVTPAGLDRQAGVSVPTPSSLDALWLARLDQCLGMLPAGQSADQRQSAVELASLLDGPVHHSEWAEACARAGITPEMALVEGLLASGLARSPDRDPQTSWSLGHWTLREAIEQRAGALGRMPELHRSCAWLLASRQAPTMALRLARHLLDAGEDDAALEPLLIAARRLARQGEYRQGQSVLAVREAAVERLSLSEDAPQRLKGILLSAHFAQVTRDYERAEALIQAAIVNGRPLDRVHALQQLCRLRRDQGELVEARGLARQALRMAEELGKPLLLAHCHRDRASVLMLEGDYERAESAFLLALGSYEASGDQRGAALALKGLGQLCNRGQRWNESIQYIERSRQLYRALNERLGESACLNALGEVARLSGRLEEAEGYYQAALDGLRNTGQIGESIAEINRALVWVARARFRDAERVLAEEQQRHEQLGQLGMAGLLQVYRLPGLVAMQLWQQAERTTRRAREAAEQRNLHDPDAARLAAQAAQAAQAAGQDILAEALSALSDWHKP